MKTNNIIRSLLFALPFAALLSACSEEFIALETGKLPDESQYGEVAGSLRSKLSFSGEAGIVLLTKDVAETKLVDELFYELSHPIDKDLEITISLGQEFTAAFDVEFGKRSAQNEAYRKKYPLFPPLVKAIFPEDNINLSEMTLTIPKGKTVSETVRCVISTDKLDVNTLYLLTLNAEISSGDKSEDSPKQILQYLVNPTPFTRIWDNSFDPSQEVTLDKDFFTVFYLNTEYYQPLLADLFVYLKYDMMTFELKGSHSFGNLINLRKSVISYDPSTARCVLSLDPDLRYVLEHRDKYISPLQNRGRKVCVCIQNGGKGIGFCNMNDVQIEDFTAQVKNVVETYGLDGVNLWDEGSGYGKEGFPPMNTTSYPKLIKSLREALPGKILTLVDKEEPTEYFHDATLCGGIEVGKYIDYAWHGYFSAEEQTQVVEPWEEENKYSDYKRKPIAGLTPEKYGNINIARQPVGAAVEEGCRKVMNWCSEGRKKNNILVFGFDLTANEPGGVFEGQPHLGAFQYIWYFADDGMRPQTLPSGEIVEDCEIFYDIKASYQPYDYGYKVFWKDW